MMDPVIPHVLDWLRLPRNNRIKLKDFLWGMVSEANFRAYSLREKDFEKRDPVLVARNGYGLMPIHKNCGRCKQFEAKCQIPEMEPIVCTQPMELVHVDYVGMEVTVAANEKPVVKNALVVVDHFTCYVQAFVTNNHTAYTTARVLYNNFFSVFGFPQKLISDQGTEFTGDVIAAMCKLLGIEKIRTTPYNPQTNGSAERVHQTLQRMIGKLDPEKRRKWPEHIG